MTWTETLRRELDQWSTPATLWWRDDDAVAATPALDRLLALSGPERPLALAVIPQGAEASLVQRLDGFPAVTLLQHGWAHVNHEAGGKAAELGWERALDVTLGEVSEGRTRLQNLCGDRLAPVLVPPWNRIAPPVAARIAGLGIAGLSVFGPRPSAHCHGLALVNCHVDPIAWKRGRGFSGADKATGELVAHLAARRTGGVDADEPTGLLTHHLVHHEALWGWLAELLSVLDEHPAVRFVAPFH